MFNFLGITQSDLRRCLLIKAKALALPEIEINYNKLTITLLGIFKMYTDCNT